MPKYVTSLAELQKELMKAIGETMIDITIDAESIMTAEIKKDVYDVYEPDVSNYQRTMEFLHSVDSKIDQSGKTVKAQIFTNPNKMQAVAPSISNNYIGQHYSTFPYNPMDYRDYLAATINFGISAGKMKMFGNGVYSRARPYFDDAKTIIDDGFSRKLISGLKKRGIRQVS